MIQYKERMELLFTAAWAVGAHKRDDAHTAYNSCRQEKAILVMLRARNEKAI